MALSVWPVTALMCLASTLRSDKTVTVVALTQMLDVDWYQLPYSRFHHIGECWFSNWWITIPDAFFLRVEFCWQFPWSLEQAIQFGIKILEEIFNCFDGTAAGIYYFKHLFIGLSPPWWFLVESRAHSTTGGPDVVCDLHTWQYCVTF